MTLPIFQIPGDAQPRRGHLARAEMFFTDVIFCGAPVTLSCDGNCSKAWGMNSRPRDDNGEPLPDNRLGKAPRNPGTYEGGHGKPRGSASNGGHNRWCCRECERCDMADRVAPGPA